ncbi:hypothetical protein K7432_007214 [Basidiobolus ranarum]|uniref:Uncharacterized protein n=1 Tax=Basidiobolus ranarum TaxID=34480 RepID=A0ABR2W0E8_9FUNG
MANPLFLSIAHYVVGICFGLTFIVAIIFAFIRGWRTSGIISHRILYFVALFNCVYAQVKIVQMNGAKNDHCIVAENLSVFFYHGSNTLQFVYYMVRYKEVYGGTWSLAFPIMTALVYAAGIPVSIVLNDTQIAPDGSCSVIHPRVSSLLPLVTAFLISGYMMCMFLAPFVQQCLRTKENQNTQLAFVARNLFVTNSVAITFNMFFNLSLITPLEQYAPLLSMVDLTINFLMVCLPYFLTRMYTPHGHSFRWSREDQFDDSIRINGEHNLHQSDHGDREPHNSSKYYQSEFRNVLSHKASDENGEVPLVPLSARFQSNRMLAS